MADVAPTGGDGHRDVREVVAHIPGIALAVDDDMLVLAWSPGAAEGLGLSPADFVGRRCYEVVEAIDAATGQPCYKHCSLALESSGPGWAQSSVISVNGSASGRILLDSLRLKCVTPDGVRSNLCFLRSGVPGGAETHSGVLQAIEAVYPVVSSMADLREVLAASLKAVLDATHADGGEVFLLDPDTRELNLREYQGLSAETMQAFRQSVIGERFAELVTSSHFPMLATGIWKGADEPCAYLCAPLIAERRVLGALNIASRRRGFDLAMAARTLFPVAAQLGLYLRWAYLAGEHTHTQDSSAVLPAANAARLRIHALGPFRVFIDGRPVSARQFRRVKALTLLKFLVAHRGRPVPRETLMELLWPGADPVLSNANLRVVLHALRRALEPDLSRGEASSFVIGQSDLVYLEASSRTWVDAEEFVQKARLAAKLASQDRVEEATAEYRDASALHQGEYMEDEPYSDWCLFERERLKEVYVNVMKEMASIVAETGDGARAIDAYRSALRVDRGREEVHRELMRLLWKDGRRDEAVRQYETCRRILREELGVDPARETESLYDEMVSGSHAYREDT